MEKLQNALVANNSGMAKIALWENDVNRLKKNITYRFDDMVVREFRGQMQLSTTKDSDSLMTEIDDLGTVKQDNDLLLNSTLKEAIIVGVCSLEEHSICLKCNGKVTNTGNEFGTCSKCGMLQYLGACNQELAAQLMIKSSSGNVMLKAYKNSSANSRERRGHINRNSTC